jgi:hypothetical protein
MKIVISSGHGLHVRGAEGLIDEVDEARKVVTEAAGWLRKNGHSVIEFHDDTSQTQSENLDTIINFHNAQDRDLDISVHFNAYEMTSKPMGTEVLYLTQDELASMVAEAISSAGDLLNRGAKQRTDLAFLNGTDAPSILIEVCFVDSEEDVENYNQNFEAICEAIGAVTIDVDPEVESPFKASGAVSWFGGPDDTGVSPDEGLAFLYDIEDAPHLFLEEQPPGTTGLARRLDPSVFYIACRWDYDETPKEMLAGSEMALVVARATGCRRLAWPADWGPHKDTNRVADVSPGLLASLGIETDDEVDVIYPAPLRRKG